MLRSCKRQHVLLESARGPAAQQRFLGAGRFVIGGDRRPDVADFLIDHGVDLADLAAQLHHGRIGRLVDAEILLVLRLQLGLGLLQGLNDLAVQNLAQPLPARAPITCR